MADRRKRSRARAPRRSNVYVTAKYIDVTETVRTRRGHTRSRPRAMPSRSLFTLRGKTTSPNCMEFSHGDRADGGLKNMRSENGELVIELYGRIGFMLGGDRNGKDHATQSSCAVPPISRPRSTNGTAAISNAKKNGSRIRLRSYRSAARELRRRHERLKKSKGISGDRRSITVAR